jgi:hypothetical protein
MKSDPSLEIKCNKKGKKIRQVGQILKKKGHDGLAKTA